MSGMDEYLSDLLKFRQKLERSDMNKNVVNGANNEEPSPSSSDASTSSSPDYQKRLLRLLFFFFTKINIAIDGVIV